MKRSWLLVLLLAGSLVALNAPAFADEASTDAQEDVNSALGSMANRLSDVEKKQGLELEIHGFVQSDYINDSTQSFNETVGDGKVVPSLSATSKGSVAGDNGFSQFSLRNSRIDFLAKQKVDDWAFKGYLEADFLGINNASGASVSTTSGGTGTLGVGGSEYKFYTQPTLRMRHAYVEADQNDGWTILAGQWWTLFGWNMDYVLNTVAEPPVMATLYERIPQVRVQKTFGDSSGAQVQVDIAAEKPDQDISQVPTQLGGIRFLMNNIKGHYCSSTGGESLKPFSLGISGRNALFVWGDGLSNPVDKLDQSIWASAVAADLLIPVLPANNPGDASIVLTGEGTYGAGDTLPFNGGGFGGLSSSGYYGGGSPAYGTTTMEDSGACAVNSTNGSLTPLQIKSYNGQVQIFLPRNIGTIFTGGYGEIFAVNASKAQLGGVNVSYNDDANWFVNVMQDVTSNVRVALEYDQFMTHYTDFSATLPGVTATDNRIQLSTWYRF